MKESKISRKRDTMDGSYDAHPYGAFAPQGWKAQLIRWTHAMPESWLGRRIAYGLRRFALRKFEGPVDYDSLGAHFRLYPYDNVCEKRILFTPQYFDAAERDYLKDYAAGKHGFVFIDIGANVGGYALFVAGVTGADARILALEPQPLIFKRLCQNIAFNQGCGVKAIACAVADKDGEVTLFQDRDNRGETGLRFVRPDHRGDGAIIVAARTLLSLIREENLPRIDALKLDVEGAEDLILEPFFRDAPEYLLPDIILVEDSGDRWQVDLLSILREKGYQQVMKTRLNLIFKRVQ